MGDVKWLGLGFTFIAWSLDNTCKIRQNRKDCLEILRMSLHLLGDTKFIWDSTMNAIVTQNETLQRNLYEAIETAIRCAIFCTSNISEALILRVLKASTVEDALKELREELKCADIKNVKYMEMFNLQRHMRRQVTLEARSNDFVGQRDVIEMAVEFLSLADGHAIKAVLLYGMGGIGKSTQAKHIFSHFQQDSSYRTCHEVLPLDTRSGHFNLWDIQKKIIEKVCQCKAPEFSNLTDGKRHLEKVLQQISQFPVLLYVDNVLECSDLSELLPLASCFPQGSRLLITSRSSFTQAFHMLGIPRDAYKAIEVKKLQKQEAQQLLWKKLGSESGEHRSNGDIESLEDKLLRLCDGLPLALEVVGSYISASIGNSHESDVEVWQGVLKAMNSAEALDGGNTSEIHSRLEFSIQKLDRRVKQAFLDVVYYQRFWFLWREINDEMISQPDLNILCQRSLLHKNENTGTIKVHDVLKALGWRMIMAGDQENLRISGAEELAKYDNRDLQRVAILHNVTMESSQLQRMWELRHLIKVDVVGECENIKLDKVRVVDDLFCSSARVLDWSQCASLTHLSWGDTEPPWRKTGRVSSRSPDVINLEVFKHASISGSLEVLKLHKWDCLKDVQVIETLTCLKVLQLRECTRIESLPEGISSLRDLKNLDLNACTNLQALPDGLTSLTGLTKLDLSFCKSLQSIPEGIGNLTGLRELYLRWCTSLQSIPEGIGNLTGLRELDLGYCESLQSIPEGIVNLTGLTKLDLSRCESLQSIPEGIGNLTGLTELHLRCCKSLRSIPEGIGNLRALTDLNLEGCSSLQFIAEGATSRLCGLTSLSLSGCVSLDHLPEGIAGLTSLTKLNLVGCRRLRALPESISGLTGLIFLGLGECNALQPLPLDAFSHLTGLQELVLKGSTSLKELGFLIKSTPLQTIQDSVPEHEISGWRGLVRLDLSSCKKLRSIEAVTTLTALEQLDLGFCSALQFIPEGLTRLASLRYVGLRGCGSLTSIPEQLPLAIGRLSNPGISSFRLDLSGCKSLQSLPHSAGNITNLTDLDLSNCSSLKSLPDAVTRLSSLTELSLLMCRSLCSLPSGFITNTLTDLEVLQLGGFAELDIQPILGEVACSMRKLRKVQIVSSEAQGLQSLPQEMTTLSCLEQLSLSGCAQIQSLPQGTVENYWRGLRKLDLSGCAGLQSLPEELITMTALSELNLSGCAGLQCLPAEIFACLMALEGLSLRGCRDLQLQESQCAALLRLTCLRRLALSEYDNDHLLQGLAALHNLWGLNLAGCSRLQAIPVGVAALEELDYLDLSGCESLQSLSHLPRRLYSLRLRGCRRLVQSAAWEIIAGLRDLRELDLSGWESMTALPHEVGNLKKLRSLDLSGCSNLQSLPESVSTLTRLGELSLRDCKSLRSLPPGITRLVSLETLNLSGCESGLTSQFSFWMSGIDLNPEEAD